MRETFVPRTSTGGHDGDNGRSLRFLEWITDPDPTDTIYEVAYAFLLRETDGGLRVEADRHRLGLFPTARWLDWLEGAGFTARATEDSHRCPVFVGRRNA